MSALDYNHGLTDKHVGFIVLTRKGKFLPKVARVVDQPDDRDAILHVVGEQPGTETLEAAQACFDNGGDQGLDRVFRKPISPGMMGFSWLSELLATEKA